MAVVRMGLFGFWFALGAALPLAVLVGDPALALDQKESTSTNAAWRGQMRDLQKSLTQLLIDTQDESQMSSKATASRIEAEARRVSQLAEKVKEHTADSPDPDPSVQILAQVFSHEAKHAYQTLKWGHRSYAREVLRGLSSYCIACHTRSNIGVDFTGLGRGQGAVNWDQAPFKSWNAFERAQWLTASRQFDAALTSYRAAINSSALVQSDPVLWERGARTALAIAVRVKNDRAAAEEIIKDVLARKEAPAYVRELAQGWRVSLEKWKKEGNTVPQTEEGYHAELMRLLADAKLQQAFPADRSADLAYLRAAAAAHQQLARFPNGKRSVEALFWIGNIYEVLKDLEIWDMGGFYYLACIQKGPHTPLAWSCYRRYEESIYQGYTGSSGTNVPSEVKASLATLKKLAEPEALPAQKLQ